MDDAIYDLGEEKPASNEKRPGLPVEPRRLTRVLLDERKLLGRVFAAAAAFALIASVFVPKVYESGGILLYEGTPVLEVDASPTEPSAFVDSAMSSGHLREVRERLGSKESLNEMRARLSVAMEGKNSIEIIATGSTGEDAQALAQTVLDVFLARQTRLNTTRLETLQAETERSLEQAIVRQDEAGAAYDAFREKSGKTHLLDDQEELLQRVASLRSDADAAAVEVAAQRARAEELEKARKDLPKQVVASATVGRSIDGPLATARAELAEAQATLSQEHPRVQALQERVRSLEKQRSNQPTERGAQTMVSNPARDAVDQELATTRAALAGAEEREAALRVLMASVKAEADALAPAEGEARQIVTALKVADARVRELKDRESRLHDAAAGELSGFRVLTSPPLPEEATRSKRTLFILGALPVLAVIFVALGLLILRLRDLSIESPRELAWWGNGPVLGTSVWPRSPDALETFVAELEDFGVHGAGRTLVVPASEVERDVACAFAMRLSEAPWLAAAVLDIEESGRPIFASSTLVTPPASGRAPRITPTAGARARRLSSQGAYVAPPTITPLPKKGDRRPPAKPTIQGFVPPTAESAADSGRPPKSGWSSAPPPTSPSPLPPRLGDSQSSSSRPPRKKTIVGLPAVDGGRSIPTKISSEPVGAPRSVRGVARATVRMVVQPTRTESKPSSDASADHLGREEAFLLTRQVQARRTPRANGSRGVPESEREAAASGAVMRAAMRLLGEGTDDLTGLRRSEPPAAANSTAPHEAVALAWNGPLGGPVLRRAARLAHRVLVVVSSGTNALELTRVTTRLGREDGVGYVLVNLRDEYVDAEDRVGDVEGFWAGTTGAESSRNRTP